MPQRVCFHPPELNHSIYAPFLPFNSHGKIPPPKANLLFPSVLRSFLLDTLSNTKVTGINQVDQLQDDTNNLIGNQLGENGLLKPVGQFVSKEGINRAERNGKDESGSYAGPASGAWEKSKEGAGNVGSGLASGAESVSNATIGNIPGVKGMMGGGEKK